MEEERVSEEMKPTTPVKVKEEPVEGSSVSESVRRMFQSGETDVVYLTDSDEEGQEMDLSELEMKEKQEFLRGARAMGFEADYEKADAIRKQVIKSVMSGFVPDALVPDPLTAGIREQVEKQVSQWNIVRKSTDIYEFLRICNGPSLLPSCRVECNLPC